MHFKTPIYLWKYDFEFQLELLMRLANCWGFVGGKNNNYDNSYYVETKYQ